jgi:molecular chaperone GrpE
MQQNGQEKQDQRNSQQRVEQPEWESAPNSVPASDEAEPRLAAEQQKAGEYLDLFQRTQADFMNYRRRMTQEQAEGRIAAQSAVLSQLLPVLDDLRRALEVVPPEFAGHPWAQGLSLIARRLTTQLEQMGVREVGAPGEQFDPHKHEAIMTKAQADIPEGTILHVARPGYILGERIIRPAQVSVAGASAQRENFQS